MFKRLLSTLAPVAANCAVSCVLAFSLAASGQAAIAPRALLTPDTARDALLANVRFLMAKGRPDLARTVVTQVLAVQNDDPETLVLLGDLELRAGRPPNAQRILERLQSLNPSSAPTRDLESLMRLYTVDRSRMTQLRSLHDSGQFAEAQMVARQLFPEGHAPGSLGREFGELLNPGITFRLGDRRGIGRGDVVGRGAKGRSPGSPPESATYVYRPSPFDLDISAGYLALEKDDLVTAENAFRRAVKLRPNSAAAFGGLGILRSRQSRHAEAEALFAEAFKRERRNSNSTWRELARSSAYWRDMAEARKRVEAADFRAARGILTAAQTKLPQETEAAILLAQIDLADGKMPAAEHAFQALRKQVPKDARVWRGLLASVLGQEAVPAERLSNTWDLVEAAVVAEGLDGPSVLDTNAVRTRARAHSQSNDLASAAVMLDRALRLSPADPWLRHDRSRLYLAQGQGALASKAMREGEDLAPESAEMKHARAIIALAQDREREAIQSIEQVPPPARTLGMQSLLQSAQFELIMRRLQEAQRRGSAAEALRRLDEASALAGTDASRLLRIVRVEALTERTASAAARLARIDVNALSTQDRVARGILLSDLGDHAKAGAALNDLIVGWPSTVDNSVLIDAQTLVASREIEAALIARDSARATEAAVTAFSKWPAPEANSASIFAARATLWMLAGSEARALEAANSAVAANPQNVDARLVRARILANRHEFDKARPDLAGLDALLPLNALEDRLTAIQIWTDIGDFESSKRGLAGLLARNPANASLRLEAARIARLEGDPTAALVHLRSVGELQKPAVSLMQLSMGSSEALAAAGTGNSPRSLVAVREAITSIESLRQPRFEMANYQFGQKATAGISQIRGEEWTAVLSWPVQYNGHIFGQIDKVRLDAGALPANFGAAQDFGQVFARTGGADLAGPVPQAVSGHSIGFGWLDNVRRIDLGVVGVGLNASNVTGGWRQDVKFGAQDAVVDISRRVETRSLLTYGGARDPISGSLWGAITNNSAAVRLSSLLAGDWQQMATFRLGVMDGRHVRSNPYIQAQVQWLKALRQDVENQVKSGVAINLWRYQHNSSGATYGQGGYYSPQAYVSVGLPVEWTGRNGAWAYALGGNLAYSWAQERQAPYFPLDMALQSTAGDPFLRASTSHGPGVSMRSLIEYRARPDWTFGAIAEFDRSRDYRPYRLGLYVRHFIDGAQSAPDASPRSVIPYAQF